MHTLRAISISTWDDANHAPQNVLPQTMYEALLQGVVGCCNLLSLARVLLKVGVIFIVAGTAVHDD